MLKLGSFLGENPCPTHFFNPVHYLQPCFFGAEKCLPCVQIYSNITFMAEEIVIGKFKWEAYDKRNV